MARNTNNLFLIIIGAIVVFTIFAIVEVKFNVIDNVINHFQSNVSNADNNATPDAPVFVKTEIKNNEYLVYFRTANNASRYRCVYGPRTTSMKESGIITFDKNYVICNIPNVGLKYYMKMIGVNNSKETGSAIQYIEN